MDSSHERLKQARELAGFETAADAARALSISQPTYMSHENGTRGFKVASAERYATRFRVSLEWLLTGTKNKGSREPQLRPTVDETGSRPVIGAVQAGVWQEADLLDESRVEQLPVPRYLIKPNARQFWLEIVGDSVSEYVNSGGHVFCTSVWDWARDTDDLIARAAGKLVVAERRRGDLVERTVKRLVVNNSAISLHTASKHPKWQNEKPIALDETGGTSSVEIVAVVEFIGTPAP
jgi:SOS-response transcriptional repressor LexA